MSDKSVSRNVSSPAVAPADEDKPSKAGASEEGDSTTVAGHRSKRRSTSRGPQSLDELHRSLLALQRELTNFSEVRQRIATIIAPLSDGTLVEELRSEVASLKIEVEAVRPIVAEGASMRREIESSSAALALLKTDLNNSADGVLSQTSAAIEALSTTASEKLTAQLVQIERRTEAASAIMAGVEKTWMDASKELVASAAESLRGEIAVRLDTIAAGLVEHEHRLAETDRRIETTIAQLTQRVDTLAQKYSSQLQQVASSAGTELQSATEALMEKLHALEKDLISAKTKLDEQVATVVRDLQDRTTKAANLAIQEYQKMYEAARQTALAESREQVSDELENIKRQTMPEVQRVIDTVHTLERDAKKSIFGKVFRRESIS